MRTLEVDIFEELYEDIDRDLRSNPPEYLTDPEARSVWEDAIGLHFEVFRSLQADEPPSDSVFDHTVLTFIADDLFNPDSPFQLQSDVDPPLASRWERGDDEYRRRILTIALRRARDLSFAKILQHLRDHPEVATVVGYSSPDAIPDAKTTPWTWEDEIDEALDDALDEAVGRAVHYAIRTGVRLPPEIQSREEVLREGEERLDRDWTVDEVLKKATPHLEAAWSTAAPHLGFGRDPDAPNTTYSLACFYRAMAHLGLEDVEATRGLSHLEWMTSGPDDLPESGTLFKYADDLPRGEADEQLWNATSALLEDVSLPSSLELAYDITRVRWYGGGTRFIGSTVEKANTTKVWKFAILSTIHSRHKYVLGAIPLRQTDKDDDAPSFAARQLRKMVRRVTRDQPVSINRVYADRGLYQNGIVDSLREVGADFLIHADEHTPAKELLDDAEPDEPNPENDFDGLKDVTGPPVNAFAYPIHDKEVGSESTDDTHRVFVTDTDVEAEETDLKKLYLAYNDRWHVETIIRQLKHQFMAPTPSDDEIRRAYYLATAALFYNFWSHINTKLALEYASSRRGAPSVTGEGVLHLIRDQGLS